MNEWNPAQPPVGEDEKEISLLRRRHTSTVCFALALLLFLLPFAEFRCGGVPVIGNTGIGIATGQSWKVARSWNKEELFRGMNHPGADRSSLMRDNPNIFALVALAAGLFGIVIAFTGVRIRNLAGMCAGILGAAMLLAVMIQFRVQMRSYTGNNSFPGSGLSMGGILRISFTAWYWLSLLLFISAAFLNYMRDKLSLQDAIDRSMDFEFQQKPPH